MPLLRTEYLLIQESIILQNTKVLQQSRRFLPPASQCQIRFFFWGGAQFTVRGQFRVLAKWYFAILTTKGANINDHLGWTILETRTFS